MLWIGYVTISFWNKVSSLRNMIVLVLVPVPSLNKMTKHTQEYNEKNTPICTNEKIPTHLV